MTAVGTTWTQERTAGYMFALLDIVYYLFHCTMTYVIRAFPYTMKPGKFSPPPSRLYPLSSSSDRQSVPLSAIFGPVCCPRCPFAIFSTHSMFPSSKPQRIEDPDLSPPQGETMVYYCCDDPILALTVNSVRDALVNPPGPDLLHSKCRNCHIPLPKKVESSILIRQPQQMTASGNLMILFFVLIEYIHSCNDQTSRTLRYFERLTEVWMLGDRSLMRSNSEPLFRPVAG